MSIKERIKAFFNRSRTSHRNTDKRLAALETAIKALKKFQDEVTQVLKEMTTFVKPGTGDLIIISSVDDIVKFIEARPMLLALASKEYAPAQGEAFKTEVCKVIRDAFVEEVSNASYHSDWIKADDYETRHLDAVCFDLIIIDFVLDASAGGVLMDKLQWNIA